MARQFSELTNRWKGSSLMGSTNSLEQPNVDHSMGGKRQQQQQQLQQVLQTSEQPQGNERTPLLNSIGAAAGSLINNSVVGGDIQQGVSWRIAAFLLVNTALGAGMLNYPYAYNKIGGIWAAALVQVVLLVFISSTMFILIYCADFNQDNTYHDVLLSMCGKRAQQISALSILLTCYGINITFLVIIGDQYDRIFTSLMPDQLGELWYLDRKFTIAITSILFIWPMCYAQRLDFLRYASILGLFAMLYVAFLTVYEHYVLDEATISAITASSLSQTDIISSVGAPQTTATLSGANSNNNETLAATQTNLSANFTKESNTTTTTTTTLSIWLDTLAIIPVLCFAYQTHEVIVPVYACMRERFISTFMRASFFGLIILFLLYNLVGAFGYLTFGENVGPDIMSMYDGKDPIVLLGILALVVKFITTYPPLMFCGRSALDGLYGELRQLSSDQFKANEKWRRIVISTLWFLSTVALAIFAPDISVTLQLLGSMASVNVFVFPGMCLVSLTYRLRCARQALLMGELPPDCQAPGGASLQRARDYHMISGTYFGAAMKRRQQLQQQLHQSSSLRNQLIGGGGGGGSELAASSAQCCPNAAATETNNCGKHFTATFASLVEFENNLASSTRSNDDQHLRAGHNSLLLNGHSASVAPPPEAPTPSSSSNSFSDLAALTGRQRQQNGYGATTSGKTNGLQQLLQARPKGKQEMAANGGTTLEPNTAKQQLLSGACDGCCCAARPINDSHEDYSDCDDASHAHRHNYLDDNANGRQQPFLNSFSASFKQFIASNQKLLMASTNGAGGDLLASANNDKKLATAHMRQASFTSDSLAGQLHLNQQHLQSANNANHHYADQSITTNSLLNKFSSSIAPSTVAQIGISRCAAMGLYSFAALLIVFGVFIFVLELVTVTGLLSH